MICISIRINFRIEITHPYEVINMKVENAVKTKMLEMIKDGKTFMEFLNETNANLAFEIGDRHVSIAKSYLRIWWSECIRESHGV